MMNLKKTLIACTVLTALAASAFAAGEAQENKTSMKDRTKQILCENNQKPGQHKKAHPGMMRPRLTQEEREKMKTMTPEQRKAFMKEKHEQFLKSLTPEQKAKYEAHRQMMKERMEAHKKLVEEKMAKLTPSQRAEVEQFIKDDIAQRKAMAERVRKMTPEQREALKVARPGMRRPGFHGPKPGMKGHHFNGQQAPKNCK